LEIHQTSSDQGFDVTPITVLDIMIHTGRQKWLIAVCVAVGAVWGAWYALRANPVFTAQATVLQPKQSTGGNAVTAAIAALSGPAAGQLAGLGTSALGGSDGFFLALLRTRYAHAWIADHLKLKERWRLGSDTAVQERVSGSISGSVDQRTGFLLIYGSGSTADEAAEMANAAVMALSATLERLSITEAQTRRAFFERQSQKADAELRKLEQKFVASRERVGLQSFTALAESGLRTSTELRARLMAREMELHGARQFAGPQNVDVLRLENEIRTIQAELRRFETGRASAQQLSPEHAQALQDFRDLKMQEALLESYIRQLAAARFDEAREGPLIQVVEEAVPPQVRSAPQRQKMVLTATGIGLLVGILLALLRAWWAHAMQNPSERERFGELRRAWFGRRSGTK
jgi:tyrosine-protein kinase Etk/Wzc